MRGRERLGCRQARERQRRHRHRQLGWLELFRPTRRAERKRRARCSWAARARIRAGRATRSARVHRRTAGAGPHVARGHAAPRRQPDGSARLVGQVRSGEGSCTCRALSLGLEPIPGSCAWTGTNVLVPTRRMRAIVNPGHGAVRRGDRRARRRHGDGDRSAAALESLDPRRDQFADVVILDRSRRHGAQPALDLDLELVAGDRVRCMASASMA